MTDKDIFEVVSKLCGRVKPQGDAAIDADRFDNMEKFIGVFREMHKVIDEVAYRYQDSPYASEKRIGELAAKQVNDIGIE